MRFALGEPRFGDSELSDRGVVRRSDGTLWHLDEEREITWAELEGTAQRDSSEP